MQKHRQVSQKPRRIDEPKGFDHRFTDANGIRLHYVDANGIRLHYVEEGKGPLVILVHGFRQHSGRASGYAAYRRRSDARNIVLTLRYATKGNQENGIV